MVKVSLHFSGEKVNLKKQNGTSSHLTGKSLSHTLQCFKHWEDVKGLYDWYSGQYFVYLLNGKTHITSQQGATAWWHSSMSVYLLMYRFQCDAFQETVASLTSSSKEALHPSNNCLILSPHKEPPVSMYITYFFASMDVDNAMFMQIC